MPAVRSLSEVALPLTTPSGSLDATPLDFAIQVPTYARGRNLQNLYVPRLSSYNWKASNTRRISASLAKARISTYQANWVFIGDSETDNYNGVSYSPLTMWPIRLRDALAGSNVPVAGSGFVRFATGVGATPDTRWTTTGTWTRTAGTMYGYTTTPGDTATFTTDQAPGTDVVVGYTNQSAAFNYSVKDAAGNVLASGAATITGAASLAKLTLTGLTNAYSVTVTHAGTSGQFLILIGASIQKTAGILVHNMAMYGSKASGTNGWQDTSTNYYNYLNTAKYMVGTGSSAWFIALGVNDILAAATSATVTAALQTIVTYIGASVDIVLLGQYQPNGVTQTAWEDYMANCYSLADTLNCPFLDLYDHSGGYNTAFAFGMMGDGTHPNQAAQIDTGTLVANLVAAAQDQSTSIVPVVQPSFTYSGTLAVTTDATVTTARWYNNTGRTLTFKKVTLSVVTAPTGAAIICDVNKNGTTIFTTQANRPQIAASANSGVATNPDILTFADGDYLTINIDQIGSTVAGATLSVQVTFT